jgi:hypothetical protein
MGRRPGPARYGVADGVELMNGVAGHGAGDGGVPGLFTALWLLVIKHADTGRDAGGAGRMTAERAGAAGGTDDLVASQHQAA